MLAMQIDRTSARESAGFFGILVAEEKAFGPAGVAQIVNGCSPAELKLLVRLLVAREARAL